MKYIHVSGRYHMLENVKYFSHKLCKKKPFNILSVILYRIDFLIAIMFLRNVKMAVNLGYQLSDEKETQFLFLSLSKLVS